MVSPLLVGLQQRIESYASIFFEDKDDLEATNEDHLKALAFRILSSAAMEQFVEERCKTAAREGIHRFKASQPTTTGRALIVWFVSRNVPGTIPVHEVDVADHYGSADLALAAFLKSADSSHGLNRRDARALYNPIGLRAHQLPEDLLTRLETLAERRDPAVHAVVGKAKGRIGPSLEKKQVFDILDLFYPLDSAIDQVVENFPSTSTALP